MLTAAPPKEDPHKIAKAFVFYFVLACVAFGSAHLYHGRTADEFDYVAYQQAFETLDTNDEAAWESGDVTYRPDPHWRLRTATDVKWLTGQSEPTVELCDVDYNRYLDDPSKYAMFRSIQDKTSMNCQWVTMGLLETMVNEQHAIEEPTGFIFHQSRCGSTLMSNLFGSDPHNLVYAESGAPAKMMGILTNGNHNEGAGTSVEDSARFMRTLIRAMSLNRKPYHERQYFKFQSSTAKTFDVLLAAFPTTPWMYIIREPKEITASYVDAASFPRSLKPCISSRPKGTKGWDAVILDVLKMDSGSAHDITDTQYCLAHLGALQVRVLEMMESNPNKPLVVDYSQYADLEQLLTKHVGPHMKQPLDSATLQAMLKTSEQYSKGMSSSKAGEWEDDIEEKESCCAPNVELWIKQYMTPQYEQLIKYVDPL